MKKFINLSLTLSLLLTIGSCKDENNKPSIEPPQRIVILDHGNLGDGRDLYVTFHESRSEDEVMSYNLILVKTGTDLTYDNATLLQMDRVYSFEKNGSLTKHQVESNFKDSDGDAIRNNQPYTAYILTASDSEDRHGSLSSGSSIELKDIPYYEVKSLGSSPYPYMEALSYRNGYIMAPGESNIYKVDVKSGQFEIFDTGLPGPLGGGFDPHDGSYYASMYGGGYVVKYELDGTSSVFADGMIGPIGIAVDGNQNVYISNFEGNTISKVTPKGNVSTFVNNSLGLINGPDGLVMAKGDLYSINFYDNKILKINSSGVPSLFSALPGSGNGYITYADDFFYATSYSDRKVYRIDMSGSHELIAGSGGNSTTDGPASIATFKNPNGIAIAGDTLFVGDEAKIRMIIKHN